MLKSQQHNIHYHDLIRLPDSSAVTAKLLTSLDGFLKDMTEGSETSEYVAPQHFKDSRVFFYTLEKFPSSTTFKDKNFFKPHILEAYTLNAGEYYLKLALIGTTEKDVAIRMIFRLKAKEEGEIFQFYSLFQENVAGLPTQTVGNVEYTYCDHFDVERAKKFDELNTFLAKNLNVEPKKLKYFKFKTPDEALHYLGIDYFLPYNGYTTNFTYNDGITFVCGIDEEGYEHDLVHVYFEDLYSQEKTYRPWEEGIACIYGGSYEDSFEEMSDQLKVYIRKNPKLDLYQAYQDKVHLGKHDIRYILNAMLCEKMEREFGFDSLTDILHCGKNGENYWEKLGKYLPINKKNFSSTIRSIFELK